jgi:hypothetical protein
MEENERVIANGGRPAQGGPMLLGDHEGVALDRLVHLRGGVPGDHARPDRGADFRQGGSPPRPEGERHDGTPDAGGHGLRLLPTHTPADEPPPPPPEKLEREREMEYFVEPEEAFTREEME